MYYATLSRLLEEVSSPLTDVAVPSRAVVIPSPARDVSGVSKSCCGSRSAGRASTPIEVLTASSTSQSFSSKPTEATR